MSSSFFRRVTRYPVGAAADPRENRLTEATAAVLEHVPELAQAFVVHLLQEGVNDARRRQLSLVEDTRRRGLCAVANAQRLSRTEVRTQVATRSGRFVDMEILVRPQIGAPGRELLLWAEVKHGADLHGDQLEAYLRDIRLRGRPPDSASAIVLLGPRGWVPTHGSVSAEILRVDWQSVGRFIADLSREPRPAEQRWLLSEYVRYLKEEGLADPDALTTATALALMEYKPAGDAVGGISEQADAAVQSAWGERTGHAKTRAKTPTPAYGRDYWAIYKPQHHVEPESPPWRGAWFEWGLRDTSAMEGLTEARGSWAFMAGVTLNTQDNPTKVAGNAAWLTRRAADGFEYFWLSGYYRLARLLYPDELLRETSLEGQGRVLGDWIVSAFAALAKDSPPS